MIQWIPTQEGVFPITVVASNGNAPDATQTFDLNVQYPPHCLVDLPRPPEPVSGTMATLKGQASPPEPSGVPLMALEFFVDGAHVYTDDETASGKYEFYYRDWDTTVLANGPHTITVRAMDSLGQVCEDSAQVTVDNPEDAGLPDAGSADASTDAAAMDASSPPTDATVDGSVDAAAADAAISDGSTPDSGKSGSAGGSGGTAGGPISGSSDAAIADAAIADAAMTDAAIADAGENAKTEAGAGDSDAQPARTVKPRHERSSGCSCSIGRTKTRAPLRGTMVLVLAVVGLLCCRVRRQRVRPSWQYRRR